MKSEFCPVFIRTGASVPRRKVFPFTSGALSCKIGEECRIMTKSGGEGRPEAVSGYTLRLPEEESVVLSGAAAGRLIRRGDGDAALLYIAVLRSRGTGDESALRSALGWPKERLRRAFAVLAGEGLVSLPQEAGAMERKEAVPASGSALTPPPERQVEYTRADMARALEGAEFASLTSAVEGKLGKKLTTPDLATLLGLYDQVGLPADVIFLLVSFCAERTAQQYGPGRRPTLRQIEREGYAWARLGLMTQESAAAYIKDYQHRREALPELMQLLRLGDRQPGPSEERYLLSWAGMGFDRSVIELAYDKTLLKCKELKWPYMNKILTSWHQKGLHTLAEVESGDRPASVAVRGQTQAAQRREEPAADRTAELQRMERYLRRMRQEQGKEE